ncbi:Rpn family recombination-promoting nuclease/putative transposase [Candidatus Poribacteria bacterium]|nr:Rpn family recombination-promoting nuclease/putative transposase [Candidatus Poribacteria bacterium]
MTEEITLLPVREFPDHGTKWLLESSENTNCLLRIVDINLAECIDASKIQHIPTTFIPDNLREQEVDVIFLAPFLDKAQGIEREVMIFVLIEHQSAPRWEMGFRMLFYMTQIWDRQRRGWLNEKIPETHWRFRPILPILFYTGEASWKPPLSITALMDLPEPLERFVPQHDTLFFNLKTTDPEELVAEGHPFGWVLRVIQKEYASKEEFAEALKLAVSNLDKLPEEERNQWEKLMYYLVLLILHRRDAEEQPELLSVVNKTVKDKGRREEVSKMGRTAAQALIEEGKALGALQASQGALLKFMQARFSHVPNAVEQKILQIRDMDKLSMLIERVARANNINEISIE